MATRRVLCIGWRTSKTWRRAQRQTEENLRCIYKCIKGREEDLNAFRRACEAEQRALEAKSGHKRQNECLKDMEEGLGDTYNSLKAWTRVSKTTGLVLVDTPLFY